MLINKQTSRNRLERKFEPQSDRSIRGAPWRPTISLTKDLGNGSQPDVRECKGFTTLLTYIHKHENIPVIAARNREGAKNIKTEFFHWSLDSAWQGRRGKALPWRPAQARMLNIHVQFRPEISVTELDIRFIHSQIPSNR